MGTPNEPTGCIQLFDCGPDGICGGPGHTDDTLLGTSGTTASGKFTIVVTARLRCHEKLFALDTCAVPPLAGPAFVVTCMPAAPTMSAPVLVILVATLALVGLVGVAGVRRLR